MTYRLPTLNGLRAFEAAARHLSFAVAANELGVTPGAVSQQVKKLETALGISLFRRLPHGLLLTREGEAYYPAIARTFDALTAATEAIAPDLNAKKFTVGLCQEAADLLPKDWPRRSKALDAFVRDAYRTDDLELILDNKLDCLIRARRGPVGGLRAIEIASDPNLETGASLQYVCRNGLIACRQTQAIVEDLKSCLA